jgi:TolB-like protein/Tfp pilus assembly protein PilF
VARFALKMLGGFELRRADGGAVKLSSKKAKLLLAYLAIAGGKPVQREKIASLLWPLGRDEHARINLRQTLYVLRKALSDSGGELLGSKTDVLFVDPALLQTDVAEFEACVTDGGRDNLEKATRLYKGTFLDGLGVRAGQCENWLREQRQRLLALAGQATRQLLEICAGQDDCEAAILLAKRLLEFDNLSEDSHRALMRLYRKADRWNEALQQYHQFEALLNAELGVAPEEETQALYRDILHARSERKADAPRDKTTADVLEEASSSALRLEGNKPSIAVLPFANLSKNSEQDYFSDGITEDIITALSRFPELFVIARNSSFAYKKTMPSVREIRDDLKVDYVVEGSVRKAGERVRVTAQLVETDTGKHVWADRFDEELSEIFELQDQVTRGIVAILPGRVANFEARKIARKPPDDMVAYELLLAAKIHHHLLTKQDNQKALELVERAIALDSEYAAAYAWKACLLGQAVGRGFLPDPKSLIQQAVVSINKAIALDENEVECHRILAEIGMETGRLDMAGRHNERALSLNPNDPRLLAQKGELLTWLGKADDGIHWIQSAMRLDPYTSPVWAHLLGRALMMTGQYDKAIDAYMKSSYPRFGYHADMAGCYMKLGEKQEAAIQADYVLELNPGFTLSDYVDSLAYKHDQERRHHQALLEAVPWPG